MASNRPHHKLRQVEVGEEYGKQRREKRRSLKDYMIRRLKMKEEKSKRSLWESANKRNKMNEEKSKRRLWESANKRNVALKNCREYRVEIEQFDLLGRNTKISVRGIEGRTKQIASVQENQWRMLEEELLKVRDALMEYE